jgi:hypothetical protein
LKDGRIDKSKRDEIAVNSLSLFANDIIFCDMLELLLNFDVELTHCITSCLINACYRDYCHIFLEKILNNNNFDPSVGDNCLIRILSGQGAVKLVAQLLKDTRVNPSALDNDALIRAFANERYSVVELLLKDSRVDPSARNNFILGYSIGFKSDYYRNIAVLFLTNERVFNSLCSGMPKVLKEWYVNNRNLLKFHKDYDKLTEMLN